MSSGGYVPAAFLPNACYEIHYPSGTMECECRILERSNVKARWIEGGMQDALQSVSGVLVILPTQVLAFP